MRKFNKNNTKEAWKTHPDEKDVKAKIRPFKLLSLTKIPTAEEVGLDQMWNVFNYVLIDWKGIEDEDGPMECNEENKELVYNYDQEFVVFIINEAGKMRDAVISNKELKNSKPSQTG